MKKTVFLTLLISSILLLACKKDYKEEVFIDKYTKIYGQWRFHHYDGMFIPSTKDVYDIEFIPFGKFSYNGGDLGNIKIISQNEMNLVIDFNNLFPQTGNSYIGFIGCDTISIRPIGADVTGKIFIRKNK